MQKHIALRLMAWVLPAGATTESCRAAIIHQPRAANAFCWIRRASQQLGPGRCTSQHISHAAPSAPQASNAYKQWQHCHTWQAAQEREGARMRGVLAIERLISKPQWVRSAANTRLHSFTSRRRVSREEIIVSARADKVTSCHAVVEATTMVCRWNPLGRPGSGASGGPGEATPAQRRRQANSLAGRGRRNRRSSRPERCVDA